MNGTEIKVDRERDRPSGCLGRRRAVVRVVRGRGREPLTELARLRWDSEMARRDARALGATPEGSGVQARMGGEICGGSWGGFGCSGVGVGKAQRWRWREEERGGSGGRSLAQGPRVSVR